MPHKKARDAAGKARRVSRGGADARRRQDQAFNTSDRQKESGGRGKARPGFRPAGGGGFKKSPGGNKSANKSSSGPLQTAKGASLKTAAPGKQFPAGSATTDQRAKFKASQAKRSAGGAQFRKGLQNAKPGLRKSGAAKKFGGDRPKPAARKFGKR